MEGSRVLFELCDVGTGASADVGDGVLGEPGGIARRDSKAGCEVTT